MKLDEQRPFRVSTTGGRYRQTYLMGLFDYFRAYMVHQQPRLCSLLPVASYQYGLAMQRPNPSVLMVFELEATLFERFREPLPPDSL